MSADITGPTTQKRRPWATLGIWIGVTGFLAIGSFVLWNLAFGTWLVDARPMWRRNPQASMQVALLALGGAAAVVGVGLTASRHVLESRRLRHDQEVESTRRTREAETERVRQEELQQDREEQRRREDVRTQEHEQERRDIREAELRARYVSILELLRGVDSVTRSAGVRALGALADDWQRLGSPVERQVCIDVLLDYLRSEHANVDDDNRATAFRMIESHLHRDAESGEQVGGSWSDATFDFKHVMMPKTLHLDLVIGYIVLDVPSSDERVEVGTIGPGGHVRITGENTLSGSQTGMVTVSKMIDGQLSAFDIRGEDAATLIVADMQGRSKLDAFQCYIKVDVQCATGAYVDVSSLQPGSQVRTSNLVSSTLIVYGAEEVDVDVHDAHGTAMRFSRLRRCRVRLSSVTRSWMHQLDSANTPVRLVDPGPGSLVDAPLRAEPIGVLPHVARGVKEERNRFAVIDAFNPVTFSGELTDFQDLRAAAATEEANSNTTSEPDEV